MKGNASPQKRPLPNGSNSGGFAGQVESAFRDNYWEHPGPQASFSQKQKEHLFLYGKLSDHSTLTRVLGEVQPLPNASISNYRLIPWQSDVAVIYDPEASDLISGRVIAIRARQVALLKQWMGDAFDLAPCDIREEDVGREGPDASASIRMTHGVVFCLKSEQPTTQHPQATEQSQQQRRQEQQRERTPPRRRFTLAKLCGKFTPKEHRNR